MQDVTSVGCTEGFVAVVTNISDDWRTQLNSKYPLKMRRKQCHLKIKI